MTLFLNRLREPSTWAGLSALGVLFGLNATEVESITGVVIALSGAAAVFLPEKKGD